jgi:hypothetical protein
MIEEAKIYNSNTCAVSGDLKVYCKECISVIHDVYYSKRDEWYQFTDKEKAHLEHLQAEHYIVLDDITDRYYPLSLSRGFMMKRSTDSGI